MSGIGIMRQMKQISCFFLKTPDRKRAAIPGQQNRHAFGNMCTVYGFPHRNKRFSGNLISEAFFPKIENLTKSLFRKATSRLLERSPKKTPPFEILWNIYEDF